MYPYRYSQDFITLREISPSLIRRVIDANKVTVHVRERIERKEAYISMGLDTNDFVVGFEVDKGHINGTEYHIITPTGLTKIYNANSWNLITILGTRPRQFQRLFPNMEVPSKYKGLLNMMFSRAKTTNIHNM